MGLQFNVILSHFFHDNTRANYNFNNCCNKDGSGMHICIIITAISYWRLYVHISNSCEVSYGMLKCRFTKINVNNSHESYKLEIYTVQSMSKLTLTSNKTCEPFACA